MGLCNVYKTKIVDPLSHFEIYRFENGDVVTYLFYYLSISSIQCNVVFIVDLVEVKWPAKGMAKA